VIYTGVGIGTTSKIRSQGVGKHNNSLSSVQFKDNIQCQKSQGIPMMWFCGENAKRVEVQRLLRNRQVNLSHALIVKERVDDKYW
jgi:hypothetical protein